MVILESDYGSLKLEILEVEDLLLHEQTILEKYIYFKKKSSLKNPIIVSEQDIIIDGNHRVLGFKYLNIKYIVACRINYFDPSVKLRYWYRYFPGFSNLFELEKIIKHSGGIIEEKKSLNSLKKECSSQPFGFGIFLGDFYGYVTFKDKRYLNAVSIYDKIQEIQNIIKITGNEMQYIPDQFLDDENFMDNFDKNDLILLTPHLTKDLIVNSILEGKIFAPKTTRHLIPYRPLNINIPIEWFKQSSNLKTLNKQLKKLLKNKKLEKIGSHQVIDGRFYEEELYMFYDIEERKKEDLVLNNF
jgi:hypothetical protein